MPDIRHMDFSLNTILRNEVARKCSDFTIRFCRAVRGDTVMSKLGEAFLFRVSDYADYALLGNARQGLKCAKIVEETIARAYELSRKDINRGLQQKLSRGETLVLFNIAWKGEDFTTEGLEEYIPALIKMSYVNKTDNGWCATVMGRDRLSATTRAATKRPRNFHSLSKQERYAIDKRLGVINWTVPVAIEENKSPNHMPFLT